MVIKIRIAIIFLFIYTYLLPQNKLPTDSLINYGDKNYKTGNYHEAIRLYQQALKNSSGSILLPEIYGKIGNVYEDLSNFSKALEYYSISYKIYKKRNDSIGIARALNQTGNIHYRWGNLKESLELYARALNIQKEKNDKQGMSSTMNNIGNIYYSWKNFDKALQNYLEVLDIKKQLGDSTELANNLINTGSVYLEKEDFQLALQYYQKALMLTQKANDKNMTANCLLNMGVLSFVQGKYNEASSYYNNAYRLLVELDNKLSLATVYRNMAETEIKKTNINKAEFYLQKALSIAKNENIIHLIADCYYIQYKIYEQKNDYKNALTSYIDYKTLNDSLFNEQARQQLNNLQARYEIEKKEKELQQKTLQINEAKKQIKIQRLWFLLIFTIFTMSVLFIIYYHKNKTKEKQRMLQEEINKQRQQALSAQMNPHFISNALNSIQKYFLTNDFEKANEFLADFGALIRKILENSRENFILLKDEITYLRLYLSLESLRLNNKFLFEINISGNIEDSKIKIPPLIVQPYIENAIWHGIAPSQEKGEITIKLKQNKSFLYWTIQDNGIGINASKQEKKHRTNNKKSLALIITKERLRLLNSYMKNKYSVSVTDLSDTNPYLHGTKVEIKMPVYYE